MLKTAGKDYATLIKDLKESTKAVQIDSVDKFNNNHDNEEQFQTNNLESPTSHKTKMVDRSVLPVGSILPWLNRIQNPSGVFTISTDLPPAGWVFCDGQVIESGQWAGLETPHINAEKGLFLRGGPHYLCGKKEEEMLENHGHQVNIENHGHQVNIGNHGHQVNIENHGHQVNKHLAN